MVKEKRGGESGFTLLEILIATAISFVAATGIYSVYGSQVKTRAVQESILGIQQNLRAAMYLMGRDIRKAGYQGPRFGSGSGAGITFATSTRFKFTYVSDDDGINNDKTATDTVTDEFNELATIDYALYASSSDGIIDDIGRTTNVVPDLVAENIEKIDFLYVLNDNTETYNDDPATYNTNLQLIRAVRLTILARSSKADVDFTDTGSYSCPTPTNNVITVWGPFNDGFHRKLITGTFSLRNMGN